MLEINTTISIKNCNFVGNDICSFICLMDDPETLPELHRISLTKTLRYLKKNLPRTFVNIVSVPNGNF
jgi:hypothetical protein